LPFRSPLQLYTFPYTTLFRSNRNRILNTLSADIRIVGFFPRSHRSQAALLVIIQIGVFRSAVQRGGAADGFGQGWVAIPGQPARDRKSTRLNSSHVKISYAVF